MDLLDSEVLCSQLGIVNAEVDASINTGRSLDLQGDGTKIYKKSNFNHFYTSTEEMQSHALNIFFADKEWWNIGNW